jgi:AraC-like DNA-binding protein
MSWYEPRAVAPDLADRLVCSWTAEIKGTHRLVPDGCVDLMWLDGAGIILCGPDTGSWDFTLPPGTRSVGIRFRPGLVADLFRISLAELRNRRVGLADLTGDQAARTVTAQLEDSADPSARVAVLESVARDLRGRCDVEDPWAGTVGQALAGHSWRISELAAETAMTERQLERRSHRFFGYGPATLRSILRLQRFMGLARRRPSAQLAELAAEAGYADQAHLSRECRSIGGQTPTELLAGQAPDWHGGLPLFLGTPRDPFAPVVRRRAVVS